MVGELLGEGSGKVVGVRVLPTEGQQIKIEVSLQGSAKVLGVEVSETVTYWQTIRPGGALYGEGHNVMVTKDGEVIDWTGFGVGRPTGPSPAAHFGVAGCFNLAPDKLARLTAVANVCEYDTDSSGNYRWKMWEWK